MIDIETEIFNSISVKVREKYSQIFLTGEYVKSPPSFPCASIVEVDNQIYRNTRTTECIENHAQLLYEVSTVSWRALDSHGRFSIPFPMRRTQPFIAWWLGTELSYRKTKSFTGGKNHGY